MKFKGIVEDSLLVRPENTMNLVIPGLTRNPAQANNGALLNIAGMSASAGLTFVLFARRINNRTSRLYGICFPESEPKSSCHPKEIT